MRVFSLSGFCCHWLAEILVKICLLLLPETTRWVVFLIISCIIRQFPWWVAGKGSKWVIIRETLELGRAPCQGLEGLENCSLWFKSVIQPCKSLENVCASSETQGKTTFQKVGELSLFFGQKKKKKDWWIRASRLGKKMSTRGQEDSLGKTLVEIGPEGSGGILGFYKLPLLWFLSEKNLWKCDF